MSLTTREIRNTFLKFFKDKSHEIIPSAPIVIKDDPTLMFTNAGMNQFKSVFVGNEDPSASRIVDTQKCLRVSGKHNDLEEVGKDHYHHTMFEMLGNWSFGDYFKKEAIGYAWELLTDVYGLEKDRLYITIFKGDEQLGVELDKEAQEIWRTHVSDDRILSFDRKDNFWEMGETGPCGPCSEIHYDMRSKADREAVDGGTLVNQDHAEVIEIWNLVFMQYNRLEDGSLKSLKQKHIDTGMGLERLARALQGKSSNYDIDLFAALIKRIEELTKLQYDRGEDMKDVAFRVISDHVRAIGFCISDGQLPSNNGAGYVVRRVLRRAIRYGFSQLKMSEPFIYEVFIQLVKEMGDDFPELKRNQELVVKVIKEEESSFLNTLEKGLDRLGQIFKKGAKGAKLDGKVAFELYDTYGFPIDLTQLIASEHGWSVDMKTFEEELQKQKDRSRKATKTSFGDWTVLSDAENSEFLGYDQLQSNSSISKYRVAQLKGKNTAQIVLDKTPFYAESGGQVGDKGVLIVGDDRLQVFDTKKENNEIIHFVDRLPEDPSASVEAIVDQQRREEVKKNHSATHLLHYALRKQLGEHVEQKGSLVAPDRLRFDFSHFEKVSSDELDEIERAVLRDIQLHMPLTEMRSVPIAEAKAIGAMALFGEKYGDQVRVIKFGDSIELCGGTHIEETGDIGGFKIVSESSVASGVRRIEAITGSAYQEYVKENLTVLEEIDGLLGSPKDLVASVEKLQSELKEAQKELQEFKAKEKAGFSKSLKSALVRGESLSYVVKRVDDIEGKTVKEAIYNLTLEVDNALVVVAGSDGEKPFIVVGISKDLASLKELNASSLVRELAVHIDGGGGGQPFLAMAGGKNKKGLDRALEEAKTLIDRHQAS